MANMPGMASQQQKKPAGPQAAGTSGLKAKKQVILEEEDEVGLRPSETIPVSAAICGLETRMPQFICYH